MLHIIFGYFREIIVVVIIRFFIIAQLVVQNAKLNIRNKPAEIEIYKPSALCVSGTLQSRESIAVLENFLSGNGWVENKIEACLNL